MNTDREAVRAYYNRGAMAEWRRIAGRPEFLLTCRFLDREIPAGARVLDIGGGPGRYAGAGSLMAWLSGRAAVL